MAIMVLQQAAARLETMALRAGTEPLATPESSVQAMAEVVAAIPQEVILAE